MTNYLIEQMYGPRLQRINMPLYRKPYPDYIDRDHPFPRGYKIPEFTLFSEEGSVSALEHMARFTFQCRDKCGFPEIEAFPEFIDRPGFHLVCQPSTQLDFHLGGHAEPVPVPFLEDRSWCVHGRLGSN